MLQPTIFQPGNVMSVIAICLLKSFLRQEIRCLQRPRWMAHTSANKINLNWSSEEKLQESDKPRKVLLLFGNAAVANGRCSVACWEQNSETVYTPFISLDTSWHADAHTHTYIHTPTGWLSPNSKWVRFLSSMELLVTASGKQGLKNIGCRKAVSSRFSEKYLYLPPGF